MPNKFNIVSQSNKLITVFQKLFLSYTVPGTEYEYDILKLYLTLRNFWDRHRAPFPIFFGKRAR